jgi:hypothetical protein
MDGEAMMRKFNNTLEGTDCGNAGLPAHSCDIASQRQFFALFQRRRTTLSVLAAIALAKRIARMAWLYWSGPIEPPATCNGYGLLPRQLLNLI